MNPYMCMDNTRWTHVLPSLPDRTGLGVNVAWTDSNRLRYPDASISPRLESTESISTVVLAIKQRPSATQSKARLVGLGPTLHYPYLC